MPYPRLDLRPGAEHDQAIDAKPEPGGQQRATESAEDDARPARGSAGIGARRKLRGAVHPATPRFCTIPRPVTRPQPATVLVASNGNSAAGWTLADAGVIQFETAPPPGATITAGFRFDVPVRFADDGIEMSRATFGAGDIPSAPLIEIKEAA